MKKGAGSMSRAFRALILIVALAMFVGLFSGSGTARAEGDDVTCLDGVACTRLPCATDCYRAISAAQNACLATAKTTLEACLKEAGDSPSKINACNKDDAARKLVCTTAFDNGRLDCITQCEGDCDPGQVCDKGWCVPEPGTIFLAVSGLGVAGFYLRRWRLVRPR
ncbi:MAG: PEP-CTERM sorting domain-containing protein [Chloroflexi bacterium]|nr:PEP-CTERM sorting domain-containing protein [Chloroflexota bacterium]